MDDSRITDRELIIRFNLLILIIAFGIFVVERNGYLNGKFLRHEKEVYGTVRREIPCDENCKVVTNLGTFYFSKENWPEGSFKKGDKIYTINAIYEHRLVRKNCTQRKCKLNRGYSKRRWFIF